MKLWTWNLFGWFILCYLLLLEFVENSKFKDQCEPCDEIQPMRCQSLPEKCRRARRSCGCSTQKEGTFGDMCSASTPRCAKGLLCVNQRGEAIDTVPWFMKRFRGTCQNVLVFPEVVENTEVDERRIIP